MEPKQTVQCSPSGRNLLHVIYWLALAWWLAIIQSYSQKPVNPSLLTVTVLTLREARNVLQDPEVLPVSRLQRSPSLDAVQLNSESI